MTALQPPPLLLGFFPLQSACTACYLLQDGVLFAGADAILIHSKKSQPDDIVEFMGEWDDKVCVTRSCLSVSSYCVDANSRQKNIILNYPLARRRAFPVLNAYMSEILFFTSHSVGFTSERNI